MYVGFIVLEKVYGMVISKASWQVLRMYDVVSKLLGETMSMYVDSLAYVRVKGGERELRGLG